jgi:hypothetical protein
MSLDAVPPLLVNPWKRRTRLADFPPAARGRRPGRPIQRGTLGGRVLARGKCARRAVYFNQGGNRRRGQRPIASVVSLLF